MANRSQLNGERMEMIARKTTYIGIHSFERFLDILLLRVIVILRAKLAEELRSSRNSTIFVEQPSKKR